MERVNLKNKWELVKYVLIVIMGFIATFVGIYFPMVLSIIEPEIIVSVGGANLGIVFVFGSFMIGYYIGEMIRPDEGDDLDATKDYGFATLGIFLGFIAIFGFNIWLATEQFNYYLTIGIFGSIIAVMTFLANITDFIKNKKVSEESFKKVFKFIAIFGVYQYLVSSYITPAIQNFGTNTLPYFLIVLLLSLALIFIFLQEVREVIPDWIVTYVKSKFPPKEIVPNSHEESISSEDENSSSTE